MEVIVRQWIIMTEFQKRDQSSWWRKPDDRMDFVKGENARGKVNPKQKGIVICFVRIRRLH